MIKVKIFLLATGMLFFSCSRTGKTRIHIPDENLVTKFGDTSQYSIAKEDVSIPLPLGSINIYKFSGTYRGPDDRLYYGYNDTTHSIDVFSLVKQKTIANIKIEKEGVRGFSDINGLFVCSPDSIFVFDNSFIGLINSNGSVIHRWPVNRNAVSSKSFFSDSHLYVTLPQVFHFEKQQNRIYILFKGATPPLTETDVRNSFRDRSFLLSYNLADRTPDVPPVYFPDIYEKYFYGNMTAPDVAFVQKAGKIEKFIYIFPVLSNIYSYDISSQAAGSYGGASSLSGNAVSHLEWKEFNNDYDIVSHFHRNHNFCKIFFDQTNQYLYRFHYDSMDIGDNDYKDVYRKKRLYLTVFDSTFNIIHEEQLPMSKDNYPVPLAGVMSDDELYIPVKGNDLAKLKFIKIKLIKKQT